MPAADVQTTVPDGRRADTIAFGDDAIVNVQAGWYVVRIVEYECTDVEKVCGTVVPDTQSTWMFEMAYVFMMRKLYTCVGSACVDTTLTVTDVRPTISEPIVY